MSQSGAQHQQRSDGRRVAPEEPVAAGAGRPTPMMAQYLEIKAAYPDSLLFYRMGDFYELFFEDAEIASRALGITLTRRGKHLGSDIAMCGVPFHASDQYLQRLIKQGYRVAVCEQTEDPAQAKKRGAKAVVRREVVRLVTPGTLTEDNLLEPGAHNYLAALASVKVDDSMALSWVDISTGDFCVVAITPETLPSELARLAPREIVFSENFVANAAVNEALLQSGAALAPLPAARFDSANGERVLKEHFQVAALEAFGQFSRADIASCGALVDYVMLTQVGKLPNIGRPEKQSDTHIMAIDAATRTNLELTSTLSGERKGSLLSTIDVTVTGPGGRLLADCLASPLADMARINARLDAVEFFYDTPSLRADMRAVLKKCPDASRSLSRLTLDRGSPRDLAAVADALSCGFELAGLLSQPQPLGRPVEHVENFAVELAADDGALAENLRKTLDDDLPAHARDGGFVRPGYSTALDEQRRLRDESRKIIADLQARYCQQTGIKALKIKHNNVLGYFVDVPSQHGAVLMREPHDKEFIHRQTLANAMRFTTTELGVLEQAIETAASRSLALEKQIFAELVATVCENREHISRRAAAIAGLDVYSALGELAAQRDYTRPKVDDSLRFDIVGGRHPVVEAALVKSGDSRFIANDCHLSGHEDADGSAIVLLTGPNMAGKSTYLRQNALIALLAQMGSFVPAQKAHIGIVDRLFSRVGAADDLARGRSTFMVEMVETATILNQASERSLVILDEIGRGTATFDGLSIAWGCVEHLHEVNRCRALFATHFHELTSLSARLARLGNATMKVREWKGDVVFLHEVGPGAADRSYGIQVARLAGLPPAVIERAGEVLRALEENRRESGHAEVTDDLPLFNAALPKAAGASKPKPSAALVRLSDILPDELTPRQALEVLYELKALSRDDQI